MDLQEFITHIKVGNELIGLDIGTATIGVAVSDTSHFIATSQKTIFRTSFNKDMEELSRMLRDRNPCGIISGLPLQPNGEEGQQAEYTRKTAQKIAERFNLPVYFQDERFSSKIMESVMIKEADLSRKKRKKVLDSSAAAYILQSFLDILANFKNSQM